jgi:ectoine hydroxylase-related dioxygenase (phytanoyl-CoA dioxygenase family)
MVKRLIAAVDRLDTEGKLEHQTAQATRHMRHCIVEDDVFLELLDWPTTFPLVVDLLGWNLKLITSHIIIRDPSPPDSDALWKATGWHRDGGTSAQEMQEPHPRLLIKIAYWLTDLSQPGRGGLRLLPGSNRLIGRPPHAESSPDPYGAVEIQAKPGDAVLFEQRTWHAVGPNRSEISRKSIFFGYAYRWIQPMDYVSIPQAILEKATPIQRQLLSDVQTQLGFYLPTDADVPLRQWTRDREAHLRAQGLI